MELDLSLVGCLKYPFVDTLDVMNRTSLIQFVVWLEDRKIRELEVEERAKLRSDSELWDAHFAEYLTTIGCPFPWTPMEPLEAVGWLLSYAIAMEYEDFSGSANNAPVLESIRGGEEEVAAAPQASDESLAAEADRLAALLGLQRLAVDASGAVENDAALLSRCNKTIRLYFSNQVAEGGKAGASTSRGQAPPPMPLESFPLGFSMGDTVLDQAAVVLKMLYLFDFRELQDDLNNVIILGQEYTANPKTNASLGKVGR